MKRRLELASSVLEYRYTFRIRWEPFLIHPHCPREGIPVEGPIGGDLTNPRVLHLKETGKHLGIDFNFACQVYPYTVLAHVLLDYAKEHSDGEKQNEVCDKLFRAYFTKGRQLELRHLMKIAEDVGFDLHDVKQYLENPSNEDRIKAKAASWRKQGIQAIPFLLVNGQPSCSGAQETETLIETITKAAAKFPLEESQISDLQRGRYRLPRGRNEILGALTFLWEIAADAEEQVGGNNVLEIILSSVIF